MAQTTRRSGTRVITSSSRSRRCSRSTGTTPGSIDGSYGSATTDAVKALQTDLGVTVDGRFGPATAKAFNEAVASGQLKPKST